MVQITENPTHDPVADLKIVDAYMRWALEAAEEVVGKDGLAVVLRDAKLERFINHYPPDSLEASGTITYNDYASLNAGILAFFGRPGKSMVIRMGRIAARKSIQHQSGTFNLATVLAAKLLPSAVQVKMGLSAMMSGLRTLNEKVGQEFVGTIEDRGDHFAFIIETCPICAGKHSENHICWLWEGTIEEACRQVFGKFFDVVEVECRAKGAKACVFEVPKKPSEEGSNKSAT
jgi:predicted hydrocarbon binding protein